MTCHGKGVSNAHEMHITCTFTTEVEQSRVAGHPSISENRKEFDSSDPCNPTLPNLETKPAIYNGKDCIISYHIIS